MSEHLRMIQIEWVFICYILLAIKVHVKYSSTKIRLNIGLLTSITANSLGVMSEYSLPCHATCKSMMHK